MTQLSHDHENFNLHSIETRRDLAKLITKLFEHWQLNNEDQAALLGLSPKSTNTLRRYRRGEPLANNIDLLDRVGHLLGIHKSLRLLYPRNRNLAYQWIRLPNKKFDDKSPLEIMKDRRFRGLISISRYLDSMTSQ
nr:antitoxin Xre-like helix-turn-helix domain-containing protein [uncultured Desulfuromonas sp.]